MNERSAEFLSLKRRFYGGDESDNLNSKEEAFRAEKEFYEFAQNEEVTFIDVLSGSKPSGAGTGSGAIKAYKATINVGDGTLGTITNNQLADGLEIYTPTIGDIILNILVVVKNGFDDSTGYFDIGTYHGGATTGIWENWTAGQQLIEGGNIVDTGNPGLGFQTGPYDFDSSTDEGSSGKSGIIHVLQNHPIQLVISQNGSIGGLASSFTSGTLEIIFIVLKGSEIINL